MHKLKVLYNSILIKMEKQLEAKSPGGIIITDPEKNNSVLIGEVVAVGSGYRTEKGLMPLEVCVGDKVIVPKNAGFKIEFDGEQLMSVPEEVVLAVL